jgi:hypothetical protein
MLLVAARHNPTPWNHPKHSLPAPFVADSHIPPGDHPSEEEEDHPLEEEEGHQLDLRTPHPEQMLRHNQLLRMPTQGSAPWDNSHQSSTEIAHTLKTSSRS